MAEKVRVFMSADLDYIQDVQKNVSFLTGLFSEEYIPVFESVREQNMNHVFFFNYCIFEHPIKEVSGKMAVLNISHI